MRAKIGLKSYHDKDNYPMADRIFFLHPKTMPNNDPFIAGLRILLETRKDLTPARIAVDAGMNNSTLRKLLSGDNASPRMATAQKLADATGYSIGTIIALGSHPGARDALEILEKFESLDPDAQKELSNFLDYLASRTSGHEEHP